MRILGIETSCDETAAAVVANGQEIISSVVATSADIHAKFGGIVPEEAARQQIKSIIPVIKESLTASSIKEIDSIAITVGPGLIGSLLVGVETAKTLSYLWKKPIIPVNHLVAHIYANWINQNPPPFPALALVVSGGHTDLVLLKKDCVIEWVGGTRDDAAGEAFDKSARLLGLPYPGGPAISTEAEKYISKNPRASLSYFPRPLVEEENFDWSFSGLKTAILRGVQKQDNLKKETPRLAAEIQEAIVDVLVIKTQKAIDKYKPKSFLLAGGVAANKRLTEKFSQVLGEVEFRVPPPRLCTDNGAYIAAYAFYNYKPTSWKEIVPNPNLTITGQV